MHAANEPVLITFAKQPVPGCVKTRLIPSLTPQQAAQTHAWMMKAVLQQGVSTAAAARVLAVAPDSYVAEAPRLEGAVDWVIGQGDGDLGQRLIRVTRRVFERFARPMILLGTDSPDLPLERIRAAAEIIRTGACAMCPSEDGGYCLLAIPQPCDALFHDVEWGSERVAQQTRAAARRAGRVLRELPAWNDVDTIDDLRRLVARLDRSRETPLVELRRRLLSGTLGAGMLDGNR